MDSVYAMLDRNARQWWYHAKLRADGNPSEARRRERSSIRENVRTLRDCLACGGFVIVGPHGWTMHHKPGATLKGYGGQETEGFLRAALAMGVPLIDTRPMDESRRWDVAVNMPMPVCDAEREDGPADPWHGTMFGCVNWRKVLPLFREAGALLLNCPAAASIE